MTLEPLVASTDAAKRLLYRQRPQPPQVVRAASSSGVTALAGGVTQRARSVNATTTLSSADYVLLCNNSGAITVNLPATAANAGRVYAIRCVGAGTVTIDPASGELIDGSANLALGPLAQRAMIVCDGAAWWTLSTS